MKGILKLTLFALILSAFSADSAAAQADEKAKRRAEELISQARAAIGDEAKIKSVKSLSLAGNITRSPSAVESKNDVEFDFLFPDKFIKRNKISTTLGIVTTVNALEGETTRYNVSSSNEMIKFQNVSQKDADEKKPVLRAEVAKWLLGLLLRPPGWSPMEFAYAGEAEADGKRADLIDVKSADGFQARLFLDKTTHRLAVISYAGKLPSSKRKQINTDENGNVTESESDSSGSAVAGLKADEIRVRFSDYRPVDGIQMPHRVVFQSGEGIKEEWELTKIRLNAPLAPEIFKKKA